VRIRIALATAVAVTLIPTLFFTFFNNGPASGRVADGTATQPGAAISVEIPLRSDVHAEKVARLGAYDAAVTVAQQRQYLSYLGILEWHGFGGYPTAGSAPLSVQLAWEAAHGQGPPDAPGRCHAY